MWWGSFWARALLLRGAWSPTFCGSGPSQYRVTSTLANVLADNPSGGELTEQEAMHAHVEHGQAHAAESERRLLIVLVITALYMLAEIVGGVLTGSLALLADSGHMLGDVLGL